MDKKINVNQKQLIIFFVTLIMCSSVSFFLGTQIKSKNNNDFRSQSKNDFNMMGGYGMINQQNRRNIDGNMLQGEIILKDENGITIKLKDGGSKNIYISNSTNISKSIKINKEDLASGDNISVIGKTNTDGSVSAVSIDMKDKIVLQPDIK